MCAKPKGFLLYPNQWDALSRLSEVKLGMLLAAIYDYMNNPDDEARIETRLDNETAIAFHFLRLQIDIDFEKYEQTVEKRRNAAQKRWAKNANDANASFAMHEKEKEIENEKEKESAAGAALNINAREAREASAAAQQDFFEQFNKEAPEKIMPWINQILKDADSKIPRLRYMTRARIRRLYDLWQEYGNAAIGEALRKAARSPFLNGRGKRNQFIADIDWVLSEQHFLEVLEGKYNVEV